MTSRPSFIVSRDNISERGHVYPQSDEAMGPVRRIGKAAGLVRIGINLQRLPPGTRSSWPHAEEDEEEFVYVIEGEVDAWIDGHLHPMSRWRSGRVPCGHGHLSLLHQQQFIARRCYWWVATHQDPAAASSIRSILHGERTCSRAIGGKMRRRVPSVHMTACRMRGVERTANGQERTAQFRAG